MTREECLAFLNDYVTYLIEGSTAEAPLWNIEKVRSGEPNKWNYIDGCMMTACLSLYETTKEPKYLEFAKSFLDYFVQEDGTIKGVAFSCYTDNNSRIKRPNNNTGAATSWWLRSPDPASGAAWRNVLNNGNSNSNNASNAYGVAPGFSF